MTIEERAREVAKRVIRSVVALDSDVAPIRDFAQAVRREALEEAAQSCDAISDWRSLSAAYPDRYPGAPTEGADVADLCSVRIRALIDREDSTD